MEILCFIVIYLFKKKERRILFFVKFLLVVLLFEIISLKFIVLMVRGILRFYYLRFLV